MALTKNPVTGMKDILPREMVLRDYVIGLIKDTYKSFGYTPIETPVVETLGNLLSKQGGDNEKLIFKILKRGEKLKIGEAKTEEDLSDSGLRYDLTVPLVRYFSAHANELPKPFKALQIGPVFRADRPQRGRFREFYQCDIDILGDGSPAAETDLLLATTTLLGRLGFQDFVVHINDRQLLKAMAFCCGIPAADYDRCFIILDKMDKIGLEGVKQELTEEGFAPESVERFGALFGALQQSESPLETLAGLLAQAPAAGTDPAACIGNLKNIIANVEAAREASFELRFDPTLVRGMSYYTGPIFEVELAGLGCAAGGGGRYDEMVGKFTNLQVPAVGLSVGFERIITILLEQNYQIPGSGERIAYLMDKNLSAEKQNEVRRQAMAARREGKTVLVTVMNKNKKFQKDQLNAEGYTEFKEFFAD